MSDPVVQVGTLQQLSFGEEEIDARIVAVDGEAIIAVKIDDSLRYDGMIWAPHGAVARITPIEPEQRIRGWLDRSATLPSVAQGRPAEIIDQLAQSAALVALHNDHPDLFYVGRLRHSADGLRLDEVLADGRSRPDKPVPVASIRRLEWQSRYLEAIDLIHRTADEASRLAPYVEAKEPDERAQLLERARRAEALVHLVRRAEPGWYSGFVVGLGTSAVVLRQLNEESLELDGYVAFRRDRIDKVALDQKNTARKRVLEARGQLPLGDQLWPSRFSGLLQALVRPSREHAPLVAVQDDEPDTSFVGHLIQAPAHGDTTMHYVAPWGIDDGTYRLPTRDIAVVEWGNRYLEALEGMRRM